MWKRARAVRDDGTVRLQGELAADRHLSGIGAGEAVADRAAVGAPDGDVVSHGEGRGAVVEHGHDVERAGVRVAEGEAAAAGEGGGVVGEHAVVEVVVVAEREVAGDGESRGAVVVGVPLRADRDAAADSHVTRVGGVEAVVEVAGIAEREVGPRGERRCADVVNVAVEPDREAAADGEIRGVGGEETVVDEAVIAEDDAAADRQACGILLVDAEVVIGDDAADDGEGGRPEVVDRGKRGGMHVARHGQGAVVAEHRGDVEVEVAEDLEVARIVDGPAQVDGRRLVLDDVGGRGTGQMIRRVVVGLSDGVREVLAGRNDEGCGNAAVFQRFERRPTAAASAGK